MEFVLDVLVDMYLAMVNVSLNVVFITTKINQLTLAPSAHIPVKPAYPQQSAKPAPIPSTSSNHPQPAINHALPLSSLPSPHSVSANPAQHNVHNVPATTHKLYVRYAVLVTI